MPLEVPGLSAKWVIGFFGLFHTAVASLGIGLAFLVTVFQIIGYRQKSYRYDFFAKRTQLFHICIYNIGTINAIGLVFALSGLYPQFWEQLFNHFFWPLIIEEFIFFFLAATITFHYFFWEKLWGHKRLQIFLGGLLIPLFFLQMYFINGIGGFMLTPGFAEAEVTLRKGILGWDLKAFYNPSFLMLQIHRSFANVSYAGFFMAGWCGVRLYLSNRPEKKSHYEDCGRLAFFIALAALLSLPIVGYFYAHVLKGEATEAFWDLMLGRGDVVSGGIDVWWLKQVLVAAMLGASLAYFRRLTRAQGAFSLPVIMVYGIGGFYLMFYLAMGMVMTWTFFWGMLAAAAGSTWLAHHMLNSSQGSGRSLYLFMGILAFLTVMLGGYSREAARPRFVNRISHYDNIYVPPERQPFLMVPAKPGEIVDLPAAKPPGPAEIIREKCTGCHSLDRVRAYPRQDWERVVRLMRTYGAKLTEEQAALVVAHLKAKAEF
jgi:cytochrome bd-type quinol oxidase subunit 1